MCYQIVSFRITTINTLLICIKMSMKNNNKAIWTYIDRSRFDLDDLDLDILDIWISGSRFVRVTC